MPELDRALSHIKVIDLCRARSGPTCVRQLSEMGVKFRLGIDYETLAEINPRLVYGSISGFGQTGPYRDRPGLDQIAQGLSGLMTVNGEPGRGPMRVGLPVADLTAGFMLAHGIVCALLERERSGKGQWVHTSPELVSDARFVDGRTRLKHRPELTVEIEKCLAARTAQEWVARLTEFGVPAGSVLNVEECFCQRTSGVAADGPAGRASGVWPRAAPRTGGQHGAAAAAHLFGRAGARPAHRRGPRRAWLYRRGCGPFPPRRHRVTTTRVAD